MKELMLSSGETALVDDTDYLILSNFSWSCSKPSDNRRRYITTVIGNKTISLSRLIMGVAYHPEAVEVDHIDGNTFNNQKNNLRIATATQNAQNRKRFKNNNSIFKGVSRPGRREIGWRARITINKNTITLGRFDDEISAARAYDEAARQHFGEFARLNFPKTSEQAA